MVFTLFTLSGPVVAGIGFYLDFEIAFWIGVALAGLNLFMNLASGVMKFPILPLIIVVVAGVYLKPAFFGSAVGLLAWTLIEGLSEIPSYFRKRG